MALLWCDGFESYGAVDETCVGTNSKYCAESTETVNSCNIKDGRDIGYKSIYLATASPKFFTPHITTNATVIAGFAFKLSSTAVASRTIISFRVPSLDGETSGYEAMDLMTTGNTDLKVNFNNASLGATSGLGLTANTWYLCEMKVYNHASAGTVDVKIDGNSVLSFSSINTQYSASWPYYSCIGFVGATSQGMWIDDFYVVDATGSTNNDWLGDCKVRDIYPTSDASGNWTANSASNKYEEVDEAKRDASSYMYTATTGNEQIFETTNITLGTIYGVMIQAEGQVTANMAKGLKILTQQGSGTVNVGSEYPLATESVTTLTRIQELDPDGNTWNQTRLDTFRIGVRAG